MEFVVRKAKVRSIVYIGECRQYVHSIEVQFIHGIYIDAVASFPQRLIAGTDMRIKGFRKFR